MADARSLSPSAGAGDVSPTGLTNQSNSKMRKRTKTGCLTCRKRRIKCGEERPTCANCIKSKRQCEGYNQRVIFKPPIGDWPNHPGVVNTMQYHTSMLPGTRNQPYRSPDLGTAAQDTSFGTIHPRPLGNFDLSNMEHQVLTGSGPSYTHDQTYQQPLHSPLHQQPLHSPLHQQPLHSPLHQQPLRSPIHQQPLQSPVHQQPLPSPHHQTSISTPTASYFPQASPVHTSPPAQFSHDSTNPYQGTLEYSQAASYPSIPVSYNGHQDTIPAVPQSLPQQTMFPQQYQSNTHTGADPSYRTHSSVSPRSDHYPQYNEQRPGIQRYNSLPQIPIHSLPVTSAETARVGPYDLPPSLSHSGFSPASYLPVQIPMHDMTPDVKYMPQPVLDRTITVPQGQRPEPRLPLHDSSGDDIASPTQMLYDAAVENEDDDYWDVQSDEDMPDADIDQDDQAALLASADFSNIRRIHNEHFSELGIRRYDAFLYDGLLTHYKPEHAASPLRNPKTARVFAHYIHVTGPALSIYERIPRNSTSIFEDGTPISQQGLWTHLLPMKAFSHQGLLHAILALASLHIARLQSASTTPSYKHYAYAVKRLVRSLDNPKRRLLIPTLATSLLLAHYEVWMAEHSSWSRHLAGAAQLITELDFPSLTREARRIQAAQNVEERQNPYQNPEILNHQKEFLQKMRDTVETVDETLVSTIVGKKVDYDDFGRVMEENGQTCDTTAGAAGKLNLQSYATLQDLFWQYARQDAYQSIISGNPLILAYRKWSNCPPRSPLGRADALYGSHDHLILLLGRIADFTVRDRERKIRQNMADGGWRPRSGMPGFGPPSSKSGTSGSQPMTPPTPMGPPPHMQAPPLGWSGPPPAGWKGPPATESRPAPQNAPETPGQSPPAGPPSAPTPSFYGMAPSRPPAPLPTSYRNSTDEELPPTPNTPYHKGMDLTAAFEGALADWNNITAAHATVAQILTSTDSFASLPDDLCPPPPGGTQGNNMTPFGPALVHRSYDISILWTLLHMAKIILLRSHPALPPAMHMAAGICAQATQPYAMLIGRITAGMPIPLGDDLSPFLGAVLIESTMSLFFAGIQFQDPRQREWLIGRLLKIDRRSGWASAGIIARGCETAWETAASRGHGPSYKRRTRRVGEDGPLVLDDEAKGDEAGRRHNQQYAGRQAGSGGRDGRDHGESQKQGGGSGNGEMRFVVKNRASPWAMNLLGTEEDLRAGMERVGL
ncbi:hypothetical protein ACN47E_006822 [Coniothyrium glycines]